MGRSMLSTYKAPIEVKEAPPITYRKPGTNWRGITNTPITPVKHSTVDWSWEGLGRSNPNADAEFAAVGKKVLSPTTTVAPTKGLAVTTTKPQSTNKGTNKGTAKVPGSAVSTAQTVAPVVTQTLPQNTGLATNQGYATSEYGNDVTTSFQRDFEAANPNAVLGADGNWTGLSTARTPTISDITNNPEAYANYDFSGMEAGSLGIDSPTSSNWIDGLSNFETLQGAARLGGLAMNAYGMFGSGGTMDVNKKNIQLMDQQIMNNASEMARRNKYRADITKSGLGA